MLYEISINNILLIDPINNIHKQCSIAVENGQLAEISEQSLEHKSIKSFDMTGKIAVPGIIDIHTHVTPIFGGSNGGFHMLAKAGVCTALDLAGPTAAALKIAARYGSGINFAVVESVRPGENLSSCNANYTELHTFIDKSMKVGAIGCKLLGGHYPLTPESSQHFVKAANDLSAYASWHAGSTLNINSIESLTDLIEWSSGYKLHVAHINSYCRGLFEDEITETQKALALLKNHPNIYSESYLAETNGVNFHLDENGNLKSKATGQTLKKAGYEDSKNGIIKALRDGFAHVFASCGIETKIFYKEEAVNLLLKNNCEIAGGFNVNPPISRLLVCLSRKKDNSFIVDAISTDGGAIPRNVIVPYGMSLVKMGMMSIEDFVYKTSIMPAKMLGLYNKGHLSIGADADITVIDSEICQPVLTMTNGKICMYNGKILNSGACIITTEKGKKEVSSTGLPTYIVKNEDFLPKRN